MKLRGAISGFGEVAARAHLPGWSARSAAVIGAIHDPVAARRHLALGLSALKGVRVYDDLGLMLDGEAVDFLDVASPPAFHAEAARMALEAGAHVLVEKPLCLGRADFEALVKTAAEHGRVLMCVHNWAFAPAYARAHQLISSGRLGEVRYLALDRLRTAPAGGDAAGWRRTSSSGGGILIDHGWHVFYLMRLLMGAAATGGATVSARLLVAEARGSRSTADPESQTPETPASEVPEEVADVRISFPGGRIAAAHLSWRAPVRRTSARIYGERAMLEIEGDRVILSERGGKSEDFSVADAADDSYHAAWFAGMAERFLKAVAEGPGSTAARENLAEARLALKLIEAARESSRRAGAEVEAGAD